MKLEEKNQQDSSAVIRNIREIRVSNVRSDPSTGDKG